MDLGPIEDKVITQFTIWYNHDGVKRAADVRRIEQEDREYFSCRLFNGTEQEIEPTSDGDGNHSWKLLYGEATALSTNLGKAIEQYSATAGDCG